MNRLRFVAVLLVAGLALAGLNARAGTVRVVALVEVTDQPDERAAARALALALGRDPAGLAALVRDAGGRAGLTASITPADGDGLEVGVEGRTSRGLHAVVRGMVSQLARRISASLLDLREARRASLERRLAALPEVPAPGPDPRAVLEVERDEALDALSRAEARELAGGEAAAERAARATFLRRQVAGLDQLLANPALGRASPALALRRELEDERRRWELRERAPVDPLRLLDQTLRTQPRPAPGWPYLLAWVAVAALAWRLETVREGARSRRRARDGLPATPPEVAAPEAPPTPAAPSPLPAAPPTPTVVTVEVPAPPDARSQPPVLGRVQVYSSARPGAASLRLPRSARGSLPDPFPSLAAKLGLRAPRPGRGSILQVTALRPGAGATLVAANLADAWARPGRKVVVVDANIRRPALHAVYLVDPDVGLTDLLLDEDLDEALQPVRGGGPRVVASGPPPPAPEEVLASPRMDAALGALAAGEDLVLLDTPALSEGGDALLVAAATDGMLVVVPHGMPDEDRDADLAMLEALEVRVLGLVEGADLGAE